MHACHAGFSSEFVLPLKSSHRSLRQLQGSNYFSRKCHQLAGAHQDSLLHRSVCAQHLRLRQVFHLLRVAGTPLIRRHARPCSFRGGFKLRRGSCCRHSAFGGRRLSVLCRELEHLCDLQLPLLQISRSARLLQVLNSACNNT